MIRARAAGTTDRSRLTLAAAVALAVAGPAPAAGAQAPLVVNCYDEPRNLVTQTMRDQCEGRVVDDEEAEAIRSSRAELLRSLIEKDREPLFPGKRRYRIGTGFFIVRDGTMVTNRHVVDGCAALSVETAGGTDAVGRLLASDTDLDLALIDADTTPQAVALFARQSGREPGVRADLIGYPTQGIAPERPLLSAGTIAPTPPPLRAPAYFLVEADVRSGNSGGPVLDGRGHVIGVVFAQLNTPKILERTGEVMPDTAVVIDNPSVHAFLRRHQVAYETANGGAPLDRQQSHELARGFVARIQCWR
jgi:S1-C subfamily serine protease